MSEETTTLPFSDMKQNALLGHLIVNEQFFKTVYQKIRPEWFLANRNTIIYKLLIEYFVRYGNHPTIPELKSSKEILGMSPKERETVYAYIGICVAETQQIRLEAIKPDLTEWLHSTILLSGMNEAMNEYNNKDIKSCHTILSSAVREATATTFDKGVDVDFVNYRKYLGEAEVERTHALTTGLSVLDKALLKDATSGGLQKGDTTVILAPVNIGKTSMLITIACHNIKAGNDVLFMTHEGRPEDIRLKIMASMMDCSINDIFNHYKTSEGVALIETMVKLLDKHIKYIPYNKAGMTIEEVVPIIRMNQEDWIANHNGRGFDLLVSDYPAILTSELAKKGTLQKRNVDHVIYDNYVQLALEYGFHSLLAIQTNREGSRTNRRTGGENRLLQVEDVQDSFGPIQQASNVITINRSPLSISKNLITFGVAKSRGSETGVAIIAKSNFAHCITHSETMQAMSYVGTKNIDEHWDKWIPHYANQRIPFGILGQAGI